MSTTGTAAAPRGSSSLVHPLYATWAPVWTKLAHCYEGSGGFLDGTYIVAHPREWQDYTADNPSKPTKKLLARRKIARYENVAETILGAIHAALFRGTVARTIGQDADSTKAHPLAKWWKNVDGNGAKIDDYMRQKWPKCGIFGHGVHVMDFPTGPTPETKADQKPPFLRSYSPLDMPDWLTSDTGALAAVKLYEVEPRTSLSDATPANLLRTREVTATSWELFNSSGERIGGGEHGFGRLPVVVQYSKRRALDDVLGKSVLNDPQLYIDLFNLTSELRELLRNQTFSILNIILGDGDKAMDVQAAIAMLNSTGGTGTENVLFSGRGAQYVTAETGNVEVYQKEREALLRTIYRLASVPWEADSRDSEAAGSLKLKREDLNQVLASYADECEKAEYQFVELWFRQEYGERWEQELERAEVVINYPDTFDVTPFAEILEQAQAALTLEMPPAFMEELRKRLVSKWLPDAAPSVIKAIQTELSAMAKEPPATAVRRFADLVQRVKGQAPPPPAGDPPADVPIQEAA